MRSHAGIYMTLEKGATYTASCKQIFNTKSSTEAELVGTSTMDQAFSSSTKTACTDKNNIPRQLSANSKTSSPKSACHINIFFCSRQN